MAASYGGAARGQSPLVFAFISLFICVCSASVLCASFVDTNAAIEARSTSHAQKLEHIKTVLRLRGAGEDILDAELYSWKGNLLQAVREKEDVVRLLDLQSQGAILWERGTHSPSTLKEILANAVRATHVPSFLFKKVAPYMVRPGRSQEPLEESIERSMAAAGLHLPPTSHVKDQTVDLPSSAHDDPDFSTLMDQPPPLEPAEASKVDSFLQQLIPEDMRSKMEVFLEQLKAVNQQRYGAKLDEALAQANGMQTGGDGGKHGGASTGAQAHTTESDNANMHVGSRNIDALRLSEVLGVMQEGLRCAARSSKDLAQLKERQREQEQTLGLDAGELPPGFRVLDTYARSVMGGKELYPPPANVTGADAVLATWIFDEGLTGAGHEPHLQQQQGVAGEGEERCATEGGGTSTPHVTCEGVNADKRALHVSTSAAHDRQTHSTRPGPQAAQDRAEAPKGREEQDESESLDALRHLQMIDEVFDDRNMESEQSSEEEEGELGQIDKSRLQSEAESADHSSSIEEIRPRTLHMEAEDVYACASLRRRRQEAAAAAAQNTTARNSSGLEREGLGDQDWEEGPDIGADGEAVRDEEVAARDKDIEDIWREMASKLCTEHDGHESELSQSEATDAEEQAMPSDDPEWTRRKRKGQQDEHEDQDSSRSGSSSESAEEDAQEERDSDSFDIEGFKTARDRLASAVFDTVQQTRDALGHPTSASPQGDATLAASSDHQPQTPQRCQTPETGERGPKLKGAQSVGASLAQVHANAAATVASHARLPETGGGKEKTIWDALGLPPGSSEAQILSAWEHLRKQQQGVAGCEGEDSSDIVEDRARGVNVPAAPARSNLQLGSPSPFEEQQEALRQGGGICVSLTDKPSDGQMANMWVPAYFAREDHEDEEAAAAANQGHGLKDMLGERNLMGLPRDFSSEDVSQPGTIRSVLEALKHEPLVDRQGRVLPSLTMDDEGWFEPIDEETPAVKDLLAEPKYGGVFSQYIEAKETARNRRQGSKEDKPGKGGRGLGPVERDLEKGGHEPHANA